LKQRLDKRKKYHGGIQSIACYARLLVLTKIVKENKHVVCGYTTSWINYYGVVVYVPLSIINISV